MSNLHEETIEMRVRVPVRYHRFLKQKQANYKAQGNSFKSLADFALEALKNGLDHEAYWVCLPLESDWGKLLLKEQQHRANLGLSWLSPDELTQSLTFEAMMMRHMTEEEEKRHASNRG